MPKPKWELTCYRLCMRVNNKGEIVYRWMRKARSRFYSKRIALKSANYMLSLSKVWKYALRRI